MKKIIQYVTLILSLALWMLACISPAIEAKADSFHGKIWIDGGSLLFSGFLGILMGLPSWYANPAWFASLMLLAKGKFRSSFIWSISAFFLGMTSVILFVYPFPLVNEAHGCKINGLGLGFFLWMASMLVIAVGSWKLKQE